MINSMEKKEGQTPTHNYKNSLRFSLLNTFYLKFILLV